jgi:hypothetical protein
MLKIESLEFKKMLTDDFHSGELTKVRNEEVRWHYSMHYFVEKAGEEIIESIKQSCDTKRVHSILNSQLMDEVKHVSLLDKVINKIGLDDRTKIFTDKYLELLNREGKFSSKVFIFNILTEALSLTYCDWRIKNIKSTMLNSVDYEIYLDEEKHILMGESLLKKCDKDQVEEELSPLRRKKLIKELNSLCHTYSKNLMLRTIVNKETNLKSEMDKSLLFNIMRQNKIIDSVVERV